jgi:cobalt/nickel transport system permease protein
MTGGHAHVVDPTRPFDGPVQRLAPETKIVATVVFVLVVMATPARTVWPYLVDAAIVGGVAVAALVPIGSILRRLVFEIPFLVLAVAMIVFGGEAGRWSAYTVLARATLGVGAASVLASTTTAGELVDGLVRLRVPAVFTAIAAFTVRYVAVLRAELERMLLAQSLRAGRRGVGARDLASIGAVLFVRSFERAERVQVAMSVRGSSAVAPRPDLRPARPVPVRDWAWALAPVAAAAVGVALAWWTA